MRALRVAFAAVILLAACGSSAAAPAKPASGACALHPVLIEDFNDLSVASRKLGPARWTAHTPWNGDFGDARFTDPREEGPFSVKDGVLSIKAWKERSGLWRSGLLAAGDSTGAHSGTRYGYFEARMKLPPGPGTWPAFWLADAKSARTKNGNIELDVIEYYGKFADSYRAHVHVWYKDRAKTYGKGTLLQVPDGSLVQDFHTYGVDVSPQAIVFFRDGKQVWSQPTPPELDGPLYPLINLALGSGWPIDKTPNPSTLLVDYVHVYGRGPGPPGGCPPGPPRR
ncbi:MAG TPA: glycoside hydrolase family 16 protein [Phenylobacterium sp.]|uniref:glycoside hydrolase family 16 protein n=1 Tax=Phenylobacterium sp. TaxID=1871053 RepID=UPI002B47FC89|nr:glycoside hydrolase family 16 protein [Phenylobacterium sp.]HKR87243.1 glycoside hydrolase family 16 protein [Phenylobacterium sp.]